MKSILLNLGSQLLRDVIAGQGGAAETILSSFLGGNTAAAPTPRPAPRPDFAYATRFAKRLFLLVAVGFVCTLFLVAGTVMAIGAIAQSIDLFGVFVASTVFYAGAMMAAVGLLGALLCVSRARRHSFSWEFFFRHGDAAATIAHPETRARAGRAESAPQSATYGGHAEVVTPSPTFTSPYAAAQAGSEETHRPGPERIAS